MSNIVEKLRCDALMFQRVVIILLVVVDHFVWFGMGVSDGVSIEYVVCIEMLRILAVIFALMATTRETMNRILTAMMVYCLLISLIGGYIHSGYHYRIMRQKDGDFMYFMKNSDAKPEIVVLFLSSCAYLCVIYFAHKYGDDSKE